MQGLAKGGVEPPTQISCPELSTTREQWVITCPAAHRQEPGTPRGLGCFSQVRRTSGAPQSQSSCVLSHTQTLIGSARETGNFCSAALSGMISTLRLRGGRGGEARLFNRLSILEVPLRGAGRGALLGPCEPFRNNKQSTPTMVTMC